MDGEANDAGRVEPLEQVAAGLRVAGVALRLQILRAVGADGPLSPSQFAAAAGRSLRESAYHFRYLREADLVALEHIEASAGTAQHFYELSPLGKALVQALPRFEQAARRPRG
ncbi:MAG TPA: helix-turn-helix domain-containing protein [Solirubrobacteraceae bacterium]|jgi:DNA-binding transcriptional ArsR family regulator